ncbi:Regulatory protein [Penicillium chrysogenum]|uniref:Regulatory protein n=1 Tax=Penicillium chrysogenum TaxID=5076 RepID=A0A167Y7D8_PENCH|nr:Regulatory protein [Penicillium chrysogenum]
MSGMPTTQVEKEELARTKALLSKHLPRSFPDNHAVVQSGYQNPTVTSDDQLPPVVPDGESSFQHGPQTAHDNMGTTNGPPSIISNQTLLNASTGSPSSSGQSFPSHDNRPSSASHRPNSWARETIHRRETAVASLETPPSITGFEWDERIEDQGEDDFVDGMAILPSRVNGGGYLGTASGAALIRLTESQDSEWPDTSASDQRCETAFSHQRTRVPFSLTSLSQLEPFVDAYFALYHCSYPIIHEATFRAQFMEVIPRPTNPAWQVLLYVVAALGAFTAAVTPTDVDIALFKAAKARLTIDVLETGNLTLVQALTLGSNYLQKRNKPNSGYNYLGLSRRMAIGIGLHKEFPTSKLSLLALETRRRVWYCLYIFDVGAVITLSRPLDLPEQGIETHLPLNIHESSITPGTQIVPSPVPETTVYTHLRAQATFHLKTNIIYSKIISTPLPSASEIIELDNLVIGEWLHSLPPFFNEDAVQSTRFTLCHAILKWRYRNLRILMYRPFLVGRLMLGSEIGLSSIGDKDDPHVELAIQRCLDAAKESVELISSFWAQDQKTTMACWYGLYFLFQAILIPVICLRNSPSVPAADDWRAQIFLAIQTLESMTPSNANSHRFLRTIHSLCSFYLHPRMDGWQGPIQESPETQITNLYPLMWPTLEMAHIDGVDPALYVPLRPSAIPYS